MRHAADDAILMLRRYAPCRAAYGGAYSDTDRITDATAPLLSLIERHVASAARAVSARQRALLLLPLMRLLRLCCAIDMPRT